MATFAILHEALAEQAKHETALSSLTLVCAEKELATFRQQISAHQSELLILDLTLLGENPLETIHTFKEQAQATTIIVIYAFAKWELIQQLITNGVRIIKAPINFRLLQASLFNTFSTTMNPKIATAPIPTFRYSANELSRLQEIKSGVDCECPNHLADLVLSLQSFEDYSQRCQNKNEKDAAIHAMLHRKTAQARVLMEEALTELCRHENIVLEM
ncbi:hypothetical protein [Beggiatoa leptomitoformis]|uniref:Uncharacterized protein n=1 Tax=Beggiatoa leptomitoformis TaxID=288004 RepID=A0A2N9YB77_9GAMM|nr:hypothetical protein [Beggiatoa leptomitoformis]ALG66911.1 hypothetical protein AL038_03240 [Beggiatoa leptomitoformis]AUI67726.1 hypothetical protein BLE401_02790 [Beggiatoa leptomitoformis]